MLTHWTHSFSTMRLLQTLLVAPAHWNEFLQRPGGFDALTFEAWMRRKVAENPERFDPAVAGMWNADRIFQAFHRLDKSVPGSGLGLALAREIAHAHRGSVHVESPHGKGANFIVTLPFFGATCD